MKKWLSTCLALLMVLTVFVPSMTVFAATEYTYSFNNADQVNDTILVDHNNVTTTYDASANAMKMTVSARTNDPYVAFATNEWRTLNASDVTHITIRIKSSTLPGAAVRIWPTTSDSLNYGGISAAAQLVLDGEYCDLIYDMRNVDNWSGTIKNIRIDISDNAPAARNNHAHIEFIKFSKGSDVGIPVTFDTKGGTLEGDNVISFPGGSNYGALPTPTREGYVFEGWYLRDHFEVTEVTAVMPRAHTLYAVWSNEISRVTLDAGIGFCAAPCKDYNYGAPYGILPEARLDGATFLGWYTEEDELITSDMLVKGDITLYAHYEYDPALANPGDVNDDKDVDNRDATALLRKLASWDVSLNEVNADVNDDKDVDNRDVTTLLRYLAGWEVTLYVPGEAAVREEASSALGALADCDAYEMKINGFLETVDYSQDSGEYFSLLEETLYARFLKDGTMYLVAKGTSPDQESLGSAYEMAMYVKDDMAYYDYEKSEGELIYDNVSLLGEETLYQSFYLLYTIADLYEMQAGASMLVDNLKYLKTVETESGAEYTFVLSEQTSEDFADVTIALRIGEDGMLNRIRYMIQYMYTGAETDGAFAAMADITMLLKPIEDEEDAARETVSAALQTLIETNSYEYVIETEMFTQENGELVSGIDEHIEAIIAEDGNINIHSKHYNGADIYPQENWYITSDGLYYDEFLGEDKVDGSSVFYAGEKGRNEVIAENWTIGDVLGLREDMEILAYDLQYLETVPRYNNDGAVYTFAATQKKGNATGLTLLSFEIDEDGKLLGFEVTDQHITGAGDMGANATVYKYTVEVDTTTIQAVKPDGFNASDYTQA